MRKLVYLVVVLLVVSITTAEEWMTFTTDDGLAHNRCQAIAVDHDGVVWVGSGFEPTCEGGVSSWDGETWTTYYSWTTDFGLRSNVVQDVFVDSENNKWFATGTIGSIGGVTKFDGETWTYFNLDSMTSIMAQWALCITEDSHGDIWIGGSAYLAHYCHGDWSFWKDDSVTFFNRSVTELKTYGDSLYICYSTGLSRLSIIDTFIYEEFIGINVGNIFIDEGVMLITTNNGLYYYQDTILNHYTTENGLIHNGVGAIYYNGPNELWIGSALGPNYFDGSEWTNSRSDPFFPCLSVVDIVNDLNGNLWFASSDGVWVFNHDSITFNIEETNNPQKEKSTYPNPFNKICNLSKYTNESINVFDIQGNVVATIPKGKNRWIPNSNLPSGQYFLISSQNEKFKKVTYFK